MKESVALYISRHQLLSPKQPVLVALSGGSDSVALLRVLLQLGYACHACHCNFHLRGKESDQDELFVHRLCDALQVPLSVAHFDTQNYAHANGKSIEMAARDLRYAFFHQVMQQTGIKVVAVAHHQADQAETVLLNLLRGSGVHGLRGMLPKHDAVIRPLLACSKEEILDYLQLLGQDFVTDSTNQELDARRNQLRLQVIPLLQQINPQAIQAIAQSADILTDTEQLMDATIQQQLATYQCSELELEWGIMKHPQAQLLLHEWLAPKGFNRSQVKQLCQLQMPDNQRFDAEEWSLWVTTDRLTLVPLTQHKPPSIHEKTFLMGEQSLLRTPDFAFLDAEKVHLPWQIRQMQAGDKFRPLGMKGSKTLGDYLTDRKVKPWERTNQWVVTDATGQILWLVGHRIDDRYKLTDTTRRVLCLQCVDNNS